VLHRLTYVEGWATIPGLIPVEHAWVTDAGRRVYEVTWETPGDAYWGMEFSVERADDVTWNGDATVLNDFRRRHPLLSQHWTGEPPGQVWPHSPRLARLRRARRTRRRRTRHAE
jgi:hypothetical protein